MKIDKAGGIEIVIHSFDDHRIGLFSDMFALWFPNQSCGERLLLKSTRACIEDSFIAFHFKRPAGCSELN